MEFIDKYIEELQRERHEEYEREHGYLKNLDKCDYYELVDRGIDPDLQISSMYR